MKKIIIIFMLINIFILPSYAANVDEYYEEQLEASGAKELSDYLSDETKDYLGKLGYSDIEFEKMLEASPGAVFGLIGEITKNGIKTPLKGFLTASGTVLLVSVCSAFFPNDEKSRIVLNIISGCILVTGIFIPASEALKASVSAIEACCDFEKGLIPVLTGVVAVSGNPVMSLTYKGAAFAAAEFISAFGKNFALPLAGISGALGITGAMMPTLRLSAVSDMIRKTMTTALSSAAGLFTGFLALKGVLSSSADGIAAKGVRLAANTFIPVIGGAIGEAYSSVMGSLSLLKNTVVIYAVAAFFLICIPVIINLALWVISLRAAGTLSDLIDCRVCSEILRNISFVFSMINTLLLLCMAVFVISTGLVAAIKTGG
ncbi:MAG: hypothetical protein IJE19_01200 [Clostridia bacterium]|nr:hypothetical protein [Clostridia bacterium]